MGAMRYKKETGGEVRISSGAFRGRKIRTPGGATHPMGERERIALFNMISDRMEGSRVADLYCGGGTLGIEALSRGADFALLIDKSPEAIEVASENLQKLGLDNTRCKVSLADVMTATEVATDQYEIVVADPPYDKYSDEMAKNLPMLVSDGGTLVLSHPGEAPEIAGLELEKTRSYAGANISVYYKIT